MKLAKLVLPVKQAVLERAGPAALAEKAAMEVASVTAANQVPGANRGPALRLRRAYPNLVPVVSFGSRAALDDAAGMIPESHQLRC
jgi:hypothetical protein